MKEKGVAPPTLSKKRILRWISPVCGAAVLVLIALVFGLNCSVVGNVFQLTNMSRILNVNDFSARMSHMYHQLVYLNLVANFSICVVLCFQLATFHSKLIAEINIDGMTTSNGTLVTTQTFSSQR